MSVILRPCFGRRISRNVSDLSCPCKALQLFSHAPRGNGKNQERATKTRTSREILRPKEGLQDDSCIEYWTHSYLRVRDNQHQQWLPLIHRINIHELFRLTKWEA